ncbi:MAG: precorrin-4 C(11)-methyltransferase [Bacteroidales bacterium]|nr:precorrin-4 C(11)-methyltransferase [Bacteroidales bacterium]
MKTVIITVSASALPLARRIRDFLSATDEVTIGSRSGAEPDCAATGPYHAFLRREWDNLDRVIFIGAMGICVRSIAPALKDKHRDPAVVCIDSTGRFVIPVLSGHIGGANELATRLAALLGTEAAVTTQSDNEGLWALDTLAQRFGWRTDISHADLNECIFRFVGRRPTALLLEVRDEGTGYLEKTLPPHVRVCYSEAELAQAPCELLITVSPRLIKADVPHLAFFPPVLHLGVGCRRQCSEEGVVDYIAQQLLQAGFSPNAIASVDTAEIKRDEPLIASLCSVWPWAAKKIFTADELSQIDVPNPSEKALAATGSPSVAEASAIIASGFGPLLIEKRKCRQSEGNDFTFALCLDASRARIGHIEIVGAGPGDPDLVSVRGRKFLGQADLILYAGSLVPVELTYCAKPGAVVRSSADMDLEEQFALMKEFYDRGQLVVRLHTGDPCIYGAIQEQMAYFDRYGMRYHITPGISSFQAAAAALRSQFTIPEKVQTIILTRGEGRTPMPEREKLSLLARSQSTMCIFLSAGIVEEVQAELLKEYPPQTPVAACYKLTWKDERIYRGELRDLARIVRDNGLTLTTMLVIGEAIGNREGLSRLYAHEFKHLFRP